jgi:hypothetical protein
MDVALIVDGANVMGSRADGWWRDRAGAMARLHGELAALADRGVTGPVPGEPGAEGAAGVAPADVAPADAAAGDVAPGSAVAADVVAAGAAEEAAGGRWFPHVYLVVEGRARAVLDLVGPAPRVRVVAARGEGDDEIASLAGRLPGKRVVVTADRELRRRCESAGAAVTGPAWLIRQFR